MIPASFDYEVAESAAHALALLAEHGEDAKLLAGGHSLLPMMKVRLAQPAVLIDIARVPSCPASAPRARRWSSARPPGTRTSPDSELLKAEAPILAYAAAQVGDPQIRHRGTIGGSLAHADPSADLPMTLLALGGSVEITGPSGVRVVGADDFFVGPFESVLGPTSCCRRFACRAAARSRGVTRSSSAGPTTGRSSASPPTAAASRWPAWAARRCGPPRPRKRSSRARRSRTPPRLAAEGTSPGYDFHADVDYREHLARVLTRRALEGKAG